MATHTVPFMLDNLYAGLGKCDGLLRDEGDHLCLEFQIRDSLAGILKTGVRQVRVPLKDLASVTLTKGWLGMTWLGVKIVIQAGRLEVLKDMPGASQGRIELSIARKDRDAAEAFVADLYGEGEPEERNA